MMILLLSSIETLTQTREGHFIFEGGDPTSNITALYIGGARLENIDLEAGDEIAIFDGDIMVGAMTLSQVCTMDNCFDNELYAFRDLLNGPGYTPGNPMLFKCWDESLQREVSLFVMTTFDPYGTSPCEDNIFPQDEPYCIIQLDFYFGGTISGTVRSSLSDKKIEGAIVSIEGTFLQTITTSEGKYLFEPVMPFNYNIRASAYGFYPQVSFDNQAISDDTIFVDFSLNPVIHSQSYTINSGYQFISSQIFLENPDMEEVISDILTDDLHYIRNADGMMLRKIGPYWVNGIGDWIETEGYLVKYSGTGQFTISGELMSPTTPISLSTGFQFISYLPLYEMDAMEAFASIIGDNLVYIRDSEGNMLQKIGPVWVNNIGNSVPGQAYLIKTNSDDVLIYPASFPCGQPFTDSRDGQIYNTVQIGEQCWMAENLNIGTMINSSIEPTNNGEIEKYCYDDDPANCDEYGGLYQWDEMMEYSAIQYSPGICPIGWYIPSNEDMATLCDFLGGEDIAGGKMKEAGTVHWNPPNTGATNSSGFTGLPGGHIISSEYFNLGAGFRFWSSSSSIYALYGALTYYNSSFYYQAGFEKTHGYSVRCIRE